jgi:hypothetical protein
MQNNVLNLAQQVSDDALGELLHLILTVLSRLTKRSCPAGEDVSVACCPKRYSQPHHSSKKMSDNDWKVAFEWRSVRSLVRVTKLILVDLWHS